MFQSFQASRDLTVPGILTAAGHYGKTVFTGMGGVFTDYVLQWKWSVN